MNYLNSFATVAFLGLAALNATAQEATLNMDPPPGTYEELPTEFTLTVEGPELVKANPLAGNYVTFITPDGSRIAAQGLTLAENTVTFKPQATVPLDVEGDYTIELKANALNLTWPDGTTTKTQLTNFVYTVRQPYTAIVTVDPAPGEYETLPGEFTFTIEGPEKIAKNIIGGGNPGAVITPDGTTRQLTGVFTDNTVKCTIPSDIPLDTNGEYTIMLRGNSLNYTWADGTKTKSVDTSFVYSVKGNGDTPDEPAGVAYDIKMIKTIPGLEPFDLKNKTLELLQLYFDKPNLKLDSAMKPVLTITGPNYKRTGILNPNMNMSTATVFKVSMADPEYNGTYTLTLPEGVLGDDTWYENHNEGHANAAVEIQFEVVGGLDPSEITTDLTFMPLVEPSNGGKVKDLSNIILSFDSYPYWADGTEFEVKRQSANGPEVKIPFGNAHPERGEGNEVRLVIEKNISLNKARYFIEIPEGSFWNEEHENDPDAGALNASISLEWQYSPILPDIQMISHVPATDARVASFNIGETGIIMDTTNNDVVTKMNVKVVEYPLDSEDGSGTTILSATSTDKTEDGAPCWINNTDSDIILNPDCFYECTIKLYMSSSTVILEELFEFYGAEPVGVSGLVAPQNDATVYTIQGFRVNRPITDLPAGMYIIGGKKVIIR